MNYYDRVRKLLFAKAGIALNDYKNSLIDNRLFKLAGSVGYNGPVKDLIGMLERGMYHQEFINAFTTNKTSFFRENAQFEDLRERVLPRLLTDGWGFSIYSCACSTGEEPYSIAITLEYAREKMGAAKSMTKIVATDLDTEVLQTAREGIYVYRHEERHFPSWVQPSKYFKRRIEEHHDKEYFLIKAKESLQNMIDFRQLNLSDDLYPFRQEEFEIIFCRNVLIYFDKENQDKILKKLFRHLKIGGTLYLGHSEHPMGLSDYVKRLGNNIFVKQANLLV